MNFVFSKDSKEREIFVDLWSLCQKYWIAEDSARYWNDLLDDIDNLNNKHNNELLSSWLADFVSQKEYEVHKNK